MTKVNSIQVHVVDDDEIVREAVSHILSEPGIQIVLHAGANDFLQSANLFEVACLVVDLYLPDISGLDLLQELKRRCSTIPCIVITGNGDIPTAVRAIQLGAKDFFEKPLAADDLRSSVHNLLEHSCRQEGLAHASAEHRKQLQMLSFREREVLDMAVGGLLSKEIAECLGISIRTVEVHRSNIRHKLGVKRWGEALRIATLADGESWLSDVPAADRLDIRMAATR